MITHLRGALVRVGEDTVLVEVNGLTYEVHVAPPVRDLFAERGRGVQVELYTYHYMQTDGNRVTPYLLGFESEAQREFFHRLMEVPRLGPLSALRAMVLPVSELAKAVELRDEGLLRKLPGVGAQRARDIVASLQGKLGRFVEVSAETADYIPVGEPRNEAEAEALEVLLQLGLSRPEALRSLRQAAQAHAEAETADELVRLVFQSR